MSNLSSIAPETGLRYMPRKIIDRKPKRVCGDCIHIWACSSQQLGNIENADATNCLVYEKYSVDNDPALLKAEIKRLKAEIYGLTSQ
jgi:hypothetical protein